MPDQYDIDLEMLADFIDESLESLSTIPGLFVEFEANPDNLSLIEAVFRPIHSLKGNAAYFGLMKVKALSHEMESVLDLLRKEKLLPSREIIDSLLAGVDEIYDILDRTRHEGAEIIDSQHFEEVYERVKALLETPGDDTEKASQDRDVLWRSLFEDLDELGRLPIFREEKESSLLRHILECTMALAPENILTGATPTTSSANPLEGLVAMLKEPPEGMSLDDQSQAVLGFLNEMAELAKTEECKGILANSLEEYNLFVERIGYDPMLKDSLLEAAESLRGKQDWSRGGEGEGAHEVTEEPATEVPLEIKIEEPEEVEPAPAVPAPAPAAQTPAEMQPQRPKESKEPGRTMRISEERVDVFLSYVGELIAVDEMLRYIHSEMVRRSTDLHLSSSLLRIVNTFTKLSDDLQASIMEIRKISVKPMLQKTTRIVRDIASASNKLIDTELSGESVTIDRSLVETLEAPMVHMIRNAADHGIEAPEDRIASGKGERGTITVAMNETEEEIVLSISDDGRGLNFEKIGAKAVKMGLIPKGAPVSEDVLKDVIFASGFSTAQKITEVSGRGVGMDAVKRSVEDAGGGIEIKSETGKGSEFRIRLPKSVGTQILNSFVVQIGEERFVLPMEKVSGSFKPAANFNRLPSGTVCVKRNDSILPVVCLDGPYHGDMEKLSEGILVTIENRENPFAFYVDTILGMQKVVLRAIPWINAEKFLGAAIMGDGRVSMIVNVETLTEMADEAQRLSA